MVLEDQRQVRKPISQEQEQVLIRQEDEEDQEEVRIELDQLSEEQMAEEVRIEEEVSSEEEQEVSLEEAQEVLSEEAQKVSPEEAQEMSQNDIEEEEQTIMERKEQEERNNLEESSISNSSELSLQTVYSVPKFKAPPMLPTYNKSYCRTQISSTIYRYSWEIDNFCKIIKVIKYLNSTPFPKAPLYELALNIHGDTNKPEDSETNLILNLSTKVPFTGVCSVSLSNASDVVTTNSVSGFIKNNTMLCNISESIEKWNKLTIKCKIEVFHKFINNSIHNVPLSASQALNRTSSNITNIKSLIFNYLSSNKKYVDFLINGEHCSVSLHLLSSLNSSYFRGLCITYQESGTLNDIVINENPTVFKEMLFYIKTGLLSKEHDVNMIQDLLTLAQRYDVLELKFLCEYNLQCHITKKNALQFIKLAILNDAKYLEESTATFIKFYQMDIIDSEEFRLLSQDMSNKIIEVVNQIHMTKTFQYIV